MRLSGQIDCLILDGNDAMILDFKTNKEIKRLEDNISSLEEQKKLNEKQTEQNSPFSKLKKVKLLI